MMAQEDDAFDLVCAYLNRLGVRYQADKSKNSIMSVWTMKNIPEVRVTISVSEKWVHIYVYLYDSKQLEPDQRNALYAELLRANYDLSLVQYSLDPNGMVVVSTEFVATTLGFEEFKAGLNGVLYGAEEHWGNKIYPNLPKAKPTDFVV